MGVMNSHRIKQAKDRLQKFQRDVQKLMEIHGVRFVDDYEPYFEIVDEDIDLHFYTCDLNRSEVLFCGEHSSPEYEGEDD